MPHGENSMMHSMISECPILGQQTDEYSLIKGLRVLVSEDTEIKMQWHVKRTTQRHFLSSESPNSR